MLELLRKIRVLLTPADKWQLIRVTLLMSAGALLEIVGIGLLMPVVAIFAKPELLEQNIYLRTFSSWFSFGSERNFLIFCCLLVAAVYVGKNLFALFILQRQSSFIYRKQGELSVRLYRTYLAAPYSFHVDHSAAELNNNVARVSTVCSGLLLPVMMFASDLLVVAALGLVLAVFMPWITLGSMAFFTLAGLAIYCPLRVLNGRWGRLSMEQEMTASKMRLSGLDGIKDIKTTGSAEYFADGYRRAQIRHTGYEGWLYTLGQLPRLTLESAAILLALGIFVIMVASGQPSGTILLTFSLLIAAMGRMLPSFSRMHYNMTRMRQVWWIIDNFYRDLTTVKAEELGKPGAPELTMDRGIEIRDLTFGYGEKRLFEHYNLTIGSKQSVALVGATGSGKTTLVDLILGLQKPESGSILADGVNIEKNLRCWRSKTAYVPQFIYLLDDTVRANVAFGDVPEEIDDARVREALEMAQMLSVVDAMEDGLDTQIGDHGVKLSGGQRQRLGIARALYRKPELLVLDEATSALDNETEAAFVRALEVLKGRLTMITIAHRLSTVEKCDLKITLSAPVPPPPTQ